MTVDCSHAKYSDGHCATSTCWNYHSKCPKHSFSGDERSTCSRKAKEVRSGSNT